MAVYGTGVYGTDVYGSTPDITPPSVPAGLSATAITSTRIDLAWTASTDNVAVTGYDVYRGGSLLVTLGAVTSYSDTSVSPSTTYSYTVDAFDAAGNHSAQSIAAGATTPSTPPDTTPPTVPSGVGAVAMSYYWINVSWSASSDNVGVTGYTVYRGGSALTTVSGSTLSYSDTSLSASTSYSYSVDAFDAAGNHSAQSAVVSATTPSSGPPPPPPIVAVRPSIRMAIAPVTSTAGTAYSGDQIGALLVGASLQMRWFFDLTGPEGNYKADLTPFVAGDSPGVGAAGSEPPQITHDSTQAVRRTLALQFWRPAPSNANMLRDLIRVRYQIRTPDGGWVEWQIGQFQCQPPTKIITEASTAWKLSAPDLSQLLVDAAFTNSFSVQAGLSCPTAVSQIVSGYGGPVKLRVAIPDNGAGLTGSLSWDAGTSRLAAVNDVLTAFTYQTAWMDGMTLRSRPIIDYWLATPVYSFDTTAGATPALSPITETPDWSHAYNQFRVVGSDPRNNPPLSVTGYYENDNPASPTSIAATRPRMAPVINDSKIVDNAAANARARVEAAKAARVYGAVSLPFLPWPFGRDLDVYGLVISTPDEGTVSRKYLNTGWVHPCAADQTTTMNLQRVVAY